MKNRFPKNFLWGAATSSHQVEGGNHNDWSRWEKKNAKRLAKEAPVKYQALSPAWDEIKGQATSPENYISGKGVDHYNRYPEDISIMKKLGLNAYRFSIEWSRVEPEPEKWNEKEIEHYRKLILELKKNEIEPMITLWHRTNPLWIADIGDWQNRDTVKYFARFAGKMAGEYKDRVKYWLTLNEPIMSIVGGYLSGEYPPQKKNLFSAYRVFKNMMAGHRLAYKVIKKHSPNASVGLTHAPICLTAHKNKLINKLIVRLTDYFANDLVLRAAENYSDFFGIQYYTWTTINFKPFSRGNKILESIRQESEYSDMGWEIYPEGIYKLLMGVWKKYRKPIIITENGIADAKDRFRADFIKDHIEYTQKAISDGADIRGYIYWSLLDNLEWDKGFWPKFGLVEVDRKTMKRTIRPGAFEYAKIIKNNSAC